MPADIYATEVNNQVDLNKARAYFENVTQVSIESFGFQVKAWSEIRAENIGQYLRRKAELDVDALKQMLTPIKVYEAVSVSKRRSGYSDPKEIEQAALAYLRERVCEAEIIEEVYTPIKVSAVAKNKDNGVDRDLPRLYIIPDQEQFPWLK
jgi:hypothetical protein